MDSSEMSKMYIDEYISRARKAQAEFEKMSQEEVDLAVKVIGKTVYDNAEYHLRPHYMRRIHIAVDIRLDSGIHGYNTQTSYMECGFDKIAAVVITDMQDKTRPLGKVDETSQKISDNIIKFFEAEVEAGRLGTSLLPLQWLSGFDRFISTITLSAFFMNDGVFPTAVVGTMSPFSVIARPSTIATSILFRTP